MRSEDTLDTIQIRSLVDIARRHTGRIVISVLICSILALLAAKYLPHKYKAKALLSIQSSYFQNPLVSDFISEVHDPSELNAQRLSLLRLALSDQFLDRLAEKYDLYEQPNDKEILVLERERLLESIEYFSISSTSFQISVVAANPRLAFNLSNEVLSKMTYTLIEQRYQTLMNARKAILKQARQLNTALNSELPSRQAEELTNELVRMEASLKNLRQRFTEKHPEVVKVSAQTESLRTRISRLPPQKEDSQESANVFLGSASRSSTQEIFDDILKKLSHLNIVLEMEQDRKNVSYLAVIEQPSLPTKAFFPDPLQFALFGVLAGFLLSALRITYLELESSNRLSATDASRMFGLEFLGELPPVRLQKQLSLVNGNQKQTKSLPFHTQES